MGTRTIEVAEEFITETITTGRKLGEQGVITCVEGLPEGARLLSVALNTRLSDAPVTVVAVFEHPEWEGDGVLTPTFTLTAHGEEPTSTKKSRDVSSA